MFVLDSVLAALADPTRRRLFDQLKRGPCTVGELARAVPVSQPAVSQHLKVLREAGLVSTERRGKERIYAVNPVGLQGLRSYVESFWDDVFGSYVHKAGV